MDLDAFAVRSVTGKDSKIVSDVERVEPSKEPDHVQTVEDMEDEALELTTVWTDTGGRWHAPHAEAEGGLTQEKLVHHVMDVDGSSNTWQSQLYFNFLCFFFNNFNFSIFLSVTAGIGVQKVGSILQQY